MSREIVKTHLFNLRLYKVDVPGESDVGVIITTYGNTPHMGERFKLSRYIGQGRDSKAGLSKSFVNLVKDYFFDRPESTVTKQIFDYIVSNFSFKDLEIVPPACPVLVFHFHCAYAGHSVPAVGIVRLAGCVLGFLETKESVFRVEDAITRIVPIAPPTTEIIECYQSSDLCSLCEKGYPKKDEIVHKTRCNHIFHATCISRYLLSTPQCPVCSTHLPPVEIRTLLYV